MPVEVVRHRRHIVARVRGIGLVMLFGLLALIYAIASSNSAPRTESLERKVGYLAGSEGQTRHHEPDGDAPAAELSDSHDAARKGHEPVHHAAGTTLVLAADAGPADVGVPLSSGAVWMNTPLRQRPKRGAAAQRNRSASDRQYPGTDPSVKFRWQLQYGRTESANF